MINVAVVGVGSMGTFHARNYSEMEGVKLVGVVDTNYEIAQEVANKYNTKAFSNYIDLLKEETLDAVSIAVPTTLHKTVAIDFCNQKVNCLVEKPIASNIEDAKQIIEAAEKNNVKLAVGHIENFNPVVRKVKEIIDKETLGKILLISTKRVGPFAARIFDVGIVVDSATHDIGVIRYLAEKEPVHIFSRVGNIINKNGDHAIIVLDFQDFFASIEVNWFNPVRLRTLTITGTKAILVMDYITQQIELYDSEWKTISQLEKKEPLKLELDHFLDCIQNNKQPLVDGYEGLKILEIALKAGGSTC